MKRPRWCPHVISLALALFSLCSVSVNKRSLLAVAAFVALSVSAGAQTQLSDGLAVRSPLVDSPLGRSSVGYPVLALSDQRLFSFANASFGLMEAAQRDVLPPRNSVEARPRKALAARDRDLSAELEDNPANAIYTGGEVGFMYGRSAGKYGGSVEQGYVLGVIGNDKFQVTAGASYEQSTVRFPRWSR
jgi:hypothetical protein